MLFVGNLLCFLVIAIDYGHPMQLNFHLSKWADKNEDDITLQHDCLLADHWGNKEDIHEITPYCLSERSSKWNIQENAVDNKLNFADLVARNITSEHLYLWSAPVDVIEEYQLYLDQVLTSNEIPTTTTNWFFNCTAPIFGPKCQYSFDPDDFYYHSSLNESIYEFYDREKNQPINQTCYIDSQCDLGLTSLCIHWYKICDGIVHCINGTDEEHCWQLEINECNENEFRCRNGQCIPYVFRDDNINSPDCLDDSDEGISYPNSVLSNSIGPVYKLEETFCYKWLDPSFPFMLTVPGCFRPNINDQSELLLFLEQPNTTSDLCWSALNCYLQLVKLLHYFSCANICQGETCQLIIAKECPSFFFLPNVPIIYGHIYLAYTREYITNQTKWSNAPQYICYDERLCGGFLSNKPSISFNHTVCRHPQDLPLEFLSATPGVIGFRHYFRQVDINLYKCNTILQRHLTFCDNATMYQCINSSKCIAQIRLIDNKYDCDYEDDETQDSANGSCPIKNPAMYANCTRENVCISRKRFGNRLCDCERDEFGLCDDEPSSLNTLRAQISFPHICDGISDLKAISINGQEETDETNCEQWPCNNVYTHCDGILDCPDGIDEVDCHPLSLINCSSPSYVCFSFETYDYICLSPEKLNDGNMDCVGGMDESNLCGEGKPTSKADRFFCNNSETDRCLPRRTLCDRYSTCWYGEDEKFCRHIANPKIFGRDNICIGEDLPIRSEVDEFLCNRFYGVDEKNFRYFSLGKPTKADQQITKRNINTVSSSFSITEIVPLDQHHCHRHPRLRVWLNKDNNLTRMTCLCPPSHYGDRCQYQSQRVSLIIQFRATADSWQTPFSIIVSLIDDSDERTIHSHEQLTYVPVPNCKTKYNVELLYATRPKNQSRQYSVHLDIYEKRTLSYRGSLLIPLPFLFLPIQRVAVQLTMPHTDFNFQNCSNSSCGYGQCVRYFDDPKQTWFCQCNPGWSGRYCHIQHNCICARDGPLCIGKLANNRSLCVCPVDRWGPRCLLHDHICQFKRPCENGGQCIPVLRYVAPDKQFVCICRQGYAGRRCEVSQNKITLSFEANIVLPQSMLVHFVEVKENAPPENGTTFKMIPIDRTPATIYWSRSFHIAFVEFIPRNYYLIVVKDMNDQSKLSETTLQTSNRCPNITEILNDTFLPPELIRRIKYYHLPCQQQSPQLSCFYDKSYLCLCIDLNHQRRANCFEFDHEFKRNCRGQSSCKNGAECLQDSFNCPESSICICPACFHGARCQFSSSGFGLSLDAILGDHIKPQVSIRHQPMIIQVSMIFTVLITAMGLLDGILSLITFINKEPRKTGCGLYLIGSSITTLLISLAFSMKFCILLAAQMTHITNQSFLLFQCRSLDFILRTGLYMDQWLNACVAMERVVTATSGISFDKKKSRTIAKFLIPTLFLLTAATNIPEVIYRRLLEDESNDEKRIWCIVDYPSNVHLYNLIMNIIHFCAPFAINLLSALIIIIKTARLRTAVKSQQNHRKMLYEQLQQHKHLLIVPLILVVLGIPRLVIYFVSGCMQSSADAWLFLMGYIISFIPPILPFFIFVAPSKTYKTEFRNTIRRYQRSIRTCFRLS